MAALCYLTILLQLCWVNAQRDLRSSVSERFFHRQQDSPRPAVSNSADLWSSGVKGTSTFFQKVCRCSRILRNRQLVNVRPFEIAYMQSEQDCVVRCATVTSDMKVACASLNYCFYDRRCELFQVAADQSSYSGPGRCIPVKGCCYYSINGPCLENAEVGIQYTYADAKRDFSGRVNPGTGLRRSQTCRGDRKYGITTPNPQNTVATVPTVGPVTAPTAGPVTAPTAGPVTRPTAGPVTGPTEGPASTPSTELVTAPTETSLTTIGVETTTITESGGDGGGGGGGSTQSKKSCAGGQSAVYSRAQGFADPRINIPNSKARNIASAADCQSECDKRSDCKSLDYLANTKTCNFYTSINKDKLQAESNVVHYDSFCVPASTNCRGTIDRVPSKVQFSSPTTETASSASDCINKCLAAKPCLSVSYFPTANTDNCLLSQQSRQTDSSNFLDEKSANVDYYGLDSCASAKASGKKNLVQDKAAAKKSAKQPSVKVKADQPLQHQLPPAGNPVPNAKDFRQMVIAAQKQKNGR